VHLEETTLRISLKLAFDPEIFPVSELDDHPWYLRYALAVALGWLFFYVLIEQLDQQLTRNFWGALVLWGGVAVWIAVLTHEISKWVLGLALLVAIFMFAVNALSSLTVPGAIIVGAIIIAVAVRK
jgi:hypothetical protein